MLKESVVYLNSEGLKEQVHFYGFQQEELNLTINITAKLQVKETEAKQKLLGCICLKREPITTIHRRS